MIDPNKLYQRLIDAGTEWTDLNAQANQLEEMKKVILSRLKSQYAGESNANAETKALASEEYEVHLTGMVEARRRADQARIAYQAACEYANLIRTVEATRREEMRQA